MIDLFKKFKMIETLGKKPAVDFKTFIKSEDFETYDNIGVLIPRDIVVVDFDSHLDIGMEILRMFPTMAIKTTRGCHLYYKYPILEEKKTWSPIRNSSKKVTYIGVKVDYRTGHNKKSALAVIRKDGITRYILSRDEIADFPFFLLPTDSKDELVGLGDGDGRNAGLYKHLMAVKDKGNLVKIDELVTFINTNVFRQGLEDGEIKTIVESTAKHTGTSENLSYYDDEGKLDHINISKIIIKDLSIQKYNDYLYYKANGLYHMDYDYQQIIQHFSNTKLTLKKKDDAEIHYQILKAAPLADIDEFPILFQNGWALIKGSMVKYDSIFTPFNFPCDYNPEIEEHEAVDNFLNFFTCGNPDLIILIEDLLGHILMTKNFPHKVFFFVGNKGNNGKSTFLKMIENWTKDLSSSISLDDFKFPFNLFSLNGKLVNLGDDIDASHIEKSRNFKTIAAGDTISVRQLYHNPVKLTNTATLIFTANNMPTFADKTGGIERRLIIFPCDSDVGTPDLTMGEKLSTPSSKSYLLNLALRGLKRILKTNAISENFTVRKKINEFLTESNSVYSWLEEKSLENKDFNPDGMVISTLYREYDIYCVTDGIKPFSRRKFTNFVCDKHSFYSKVERRGKDIARVFRQKLE